MFAKGLHGQQLPYLPWTAPQHVVRTLLWCPDTLQSLRGSAGPRHRRPCACLGKVLSGTDQYGHVDVQISAHPTNNGWHRW
jgi:hypothetical protein